MRCEPWMNRDERPLGRRISDLLSYAAECRRRAVRLEREARQASRDADEAERNAENLRTAR